MYKFYFIENIYDFERYKEDLLSLLNKSLDDDAILGFNKKLDDEEKARYLDILRNNLKAEVLVILVGIDVNDKVISTCQIKTTLQNNTKHIADLQKGIIDPEYRRTSLLNLTLHEISSYCLRRRIELLTLDVRENTPAHKVWLKYGFKVYGVLEDYSRFKKEKYNGVYMVQASQALYSLTHSNIQ